MWELDYKESWALKNWCFWTVVLEKTLESPLDWKKIKPVHPKEKQPWISSGRTDAEAETPILWPPDAKNWLIWKDPDAGKDWRREEKGMTEDEMVGWHQRLNEQELLMDREAWCAAVHRVKKSWTWWNDWTDLRCLGINYYINRIFILLPLCMNFVLTSIHLSGGKMRPCPRQNANRRNKARRYVSFVMQKQD